MSTKKHQLKKNSDFKKWQTVVFALLAIGWMIVIFQSSSADGDTSSMSSDAVYTHFFNWMPYSLEVIKFIRKSAHFIAYAVLGFLFANFFGSLMDDDRHVLIFSFLSGLCYAVSDELHQAFVPGRSAMVTDVLIDGAGIIVGILLAWGMIAAIDYFVSKHRGKT